MESKTLGVTKLSLPTGGGAIRGIGETFQPNEFTGTASLSIPIQTSSCRNYEPHLSLDYSSGSGNGIFGIGFSLSIPNISRKIAKAIPKYDDTDVFVIFNADDLVPVPSGPQSVNEEGVEYSIFTYRPRTEELFARIEKWVNATAGDVHWRITTKDNVTSIFGQSEAACIADPADKTRVFQWLIERSYDAKGDQIVYEYQAETGNKHIRRIKYGNDRPTKKPDSNTYWHFEVGFEYSEPAKVENLTNDRGDVGTGPTRARPDPFSSYKSGFELRTSVRCMRISMSHRFQSVAEGKLFEVSATQFEYDAQSTMTFLRAVKHLGYREQVGKGIVSQEVPPLEFTWSKFQLDEMPGAVSAEAPGFKPLEEAGHTIPGFLERGGHQMVDLYGEGLPGILYTDADAVLYSSPLGDGRYASFAAPHAFPIERNLQGVQNSLMDLGGDGKLDLVVTTPARTGYYELGSDGNWEPYRSFASTPTELHHPHRQMVDVTGDGLADLLLFEEDAVKVYASKGKLGYNESLRQLRGRPASPLPVTSNLSAREAIHFADLFGDGGSHLVRIRNGSVECWPNLGYGRFGSKVELGNAPSFGSEMDASRLFLTDIDGSGTTDLVYAYPDRIDIYRNESGNRFSDAISVPLPRAWNNVSQINFADVLGNGTACLVFTSVNDDLGLDHQYYDFTGAVKPHLLTAVDNNMGATTIIHYSPSTKFYLADKKAGTPWITRLPFPVQVVEKIETIDHLGGSRLVTGYDYHHGYFDPIEREFRGFGRVDRTDAESFERFSRVDANDGSLQVAPVLTKTWYHTGAYAEAVTISQQYTSEYYQRDVAAKALPDSNLDAAFLENSENTSEAYRALHGHVLREEVYSLDQEQNPEVGEPLNGHPYTVTESNFHVRLIQPKADQPSAVCLVHPRETISYHYERNPADPRISHTLTLEVDEFGNTIKSLAIGYGRRPVSIASTDPALTPEDQARQSQLLITYTDDLFTNSVMTPSDYLAPLSCETRTYELTGYTPENKAVRFSFEDWTRNSFALLSAAAEIPYEQTANSTTPQKRLIEHVRTLYRKDDLTGLLPLGVVESHALPGESYHLAFTPGLLAQVFKRNGSLLLPDPANVLSGQAGGEAGNWGGYLSSQELKADGRFPHSDADDHWWIPTGRVFLSTNSAHTAAEERAYAAQHFFLPHRLRDPFHTDSASTESVVFYDVYDLLVTSTSDALGNTLKSDNDYRALQPHLVTDANGNRTAVAFDALGMVVATAVMGKESENLGDLLADFNADPSLAGLQAFIADPQTQAASMLGKATTRIVYDLDRYQRCLQPPFAATLARETHRSDPGGEQSKIQISFSYSDGFGREIQKKIQAEAGDAPQRNAPEQLPAGDIRPGDLVRDQGELTQANTTRRWVGTGRTVYNNKGQPVKQYEPFFSSTHLYEMESEMTDTGVTSILFYDALERIVATLHPNHTFDKVVFDPWRHETWDVNDTVLINPREDPHVSDFFRRLPQADYLPTWYEQRRAGQKGADEKAAADKTVAHAATPTVAHADSLGRTFLTVAHNKYQRSDSDSLTEEFHRTQVIFDIEGNHREFIDANGRIAMRYNYDLLGNRIYQASMDAGERWVLNDVAGKSLYHWDSKDRQFRNEYDRLRRPTDSFMRESAEAEILIGRTVYGETEDTPEKNNLRGKVVQIIDQAGVITHHAYDFKGNLLSGQRQLAQVYWKTLDWSSSPAPALEEPSYTGSTRYDALNRPTEATAPDQSVIRPAYNEAGLLMRVEANVRDAAVATEFVKDVAYDARRQRARIDYGNGVRTTHEYDPKTFRLKRLRTTRASDQAALQDLSYTYDPAGNITHIRDDAQQTIFFNGQVVPPECDYAYDASYRLIKATGREHIGQSQKPPETSWNDEYRVNLPHPNDAKAMRNYAEQYVFDAAGNLANLIHQAANGNWTRSQTCSEPSLLEPDKVSNRLTSTKVGDGQSETYSYDAHGNMTSMQHLALMQWDHLDQLQATAQQVVNNGGTPETTWHVYDANGQRVRKVTASQAAAERPGKREAERLYLGGFEIYREYRSDGNAITLERETLHIMDDEQRVALIETRTQGNDKSAKQLTRYQFDNHLGSAALELDHQAQIISYEEYTPFGSTSYQAVRGKTETPKRYRYSGKERDQSTGFYYYGARYYAPWLGRWTSTDPAGTIDGLNLYAFVGANPLSFADRFGLKKTKTETPDDPPTGSSPKPAKKLKPKAATGEKVVPMDFQDELNRRATIKPPDAVLHSLPKLKKGRFVKAVYDEGSQTVTYVWSKKTLQDEFVRNGDKSLYKYIKQQIRKKPIKANETLGIGLIANTTVDADDKMEPASDTWIKNNWKTLGKGPIPKNPKGSVSVFQSLAIIDPPELFPYYMGKSKKLGVKRPTTKITTPDIDLKILEQNVDEWISRGHGGTTVTNDPDEYYQNQGPLNAKVNQTYGGAEGAISRAKPNKVIVGLAVHFL